MGVQQVLAWEKAVPLDSAGITYTVKREAGVRITPAIPAQKAEEGGLLLAWVTLGYIASYRPVWFTE